MSELTLMCITTILCCDLRFNKILSDVTLLIWSHFIIMRHLGKYTVVCSIGTWEDNFSHLIPTKKVHVII
jgi:hypothetical protein